MPALFDTASASRGEVLAAMLGGVAGDLYDIEPAAALPGAEVLTVDGLRRPRPARRTSPSPSARGEIVGVFGLIGSGIETLGRALYGALGPVDARRGARSPAPPYRPQSPRAGKDAGIGFVAADRKQRGHHRRPHGAREHGRAVPGAATSQRPVRLARRGDRAGEALDRDARHPHPRAASSDAHALRRQPAEGLRRRAGWSTA